MGKVIDFFSGRELIQSKKESPYVTITIEEGVYTFDHNLDKDFDCADFTEEALECWIVMCIEDMDDE